MSQELQRLINQAADEGNWQKATTTARAMPTGWNAFEQLSSHPNLTDEGVNHILDVVTDPKSKHNKDKASVLFELASNLRDNPDIKPETLNRMAAHVKDDHYAASILTSHKNFKPDDKMQSLSNAANFWSSYERNVHPDHFATIKSLYTKQPESLTDHRNQVGSSEKYSHLFPDLQHHASRVQEEILKDSFVQKRDIKGKTHILLHRGVGGEYAKAIKDAISHNHQDNTANNKTLKVPTAHLTSWSTNPEVAGRFAHNRAESLGGETGQHGLVMSKWIPLDSVLHSGHHTTVIGQEHPHQHEEEVVVGHPEGHVKVSTSNLSMKLPHHSYGQFEKVKTKVQKNEDYISEELLAKASIPKYVTGAIAASMIGLSPAKVANQSQNLFNPNLPVHAVQEHEIKPHPDLDTIAFLESSGGKNLNHELVTSGVNKGTKAIGKYGLMPAHILHTIKNDKNLKSKYKDVLKLDPVQDQGKISQMAENHPTFYTEVANAHWNKLGKLFNHDKNKMAHAHFNGIAGTARKDSDAVADHWYVKRFNNYNKIKSLETKERMPTASFKVQKSLATHGIVSFKSLFESPSDKYVESLINQSIKKDDVHDLSHVGHFTHHSIVAGSQTDSSFLLKLEPTNSPAIKSVKNGLQTIKEAAFYEIAHLVFGMEKFIPRAYLGSVIKNNEEWPCAAIKMLPNDFKSLSDIEEQEKGKALEILKPYLLSGDLHKLAGMFYILGEADAHANNILTDGTYIKCIDHGSSFGDSSFNPHSEPDSFIPYILRAGIVKDSMDDSEKLDKMLKVVDPEINKGIRYFLTSIDTNKLVELLKKYELDPLPVVHRLNTLHDKLNSSERADVAVNEIWVKGADLHSTQKGV